MDFSLSQVAQLLYYTTRLIGKTPLEQLLIYLADSDGEAATRAIADADESDLPNVQLRSAATLLRAVHQR